MKTAQIKTIKLSEESHTKEHKRCLSEKCPGQIQEQPYLLQGLLRNLQLNLTEMSTHVADSWEVLKVEIRAKHSFFSSKFKISYATAPINLNTLPEKFWSYRQETVFPPKIKADFYFGKV